MFYSVCLRSSRQAAELFRAGRAERRQRRQGNFRLLFLFRLEGTPFFLGHPGGRRQPTTDAPDADGPSTIDCTHTHKKTHRIQPELKRAETL